MSTLPALSDVIIPVGGVFLAFVAAVGVSIADRRHRARKRNPKPRPQPPRVGDAAHPFSANLVNLQAKRSEGFASNPALPSQKRGLQQANLLHH